MNYRERDIHCEALSIEQLQKVLNLLSTFSCLNELAVVE